MTPVKTPLRPPFLRCIPALIFGVTFCSLLLSAEPGGIKSFNIPAGAATGTLKSFVQQSGVEVLYSVDTVVGAKTNAVRGDMMPREALLRLLDGTGLSVAQGRNNGALAVTR